MSADNIDSSEVDVPGGLSVFDILGKLNSLVTPNLSTAYTLCGRRPLDTENSPQTFTFLLHTGEPRA